MVDNSSSGIPEGHPKHRPLPFECIALLLQGGGALGAYQAGVYEALAEANLEPDWIAGISIGAINAALIAGNAAGDRVDRLRTFWHSVTRDTLSMPMPSLPTQAGDASAHQMMNWLSAVEAYLTGVPGFFTPRLLTPWLEPKGSVKATSFYDTHALRRTLETLVDFERLNSGEIQLTVGAVNVETGDFVNFDNRERKITVDHIMASGALPPGLPPVDADGAYYWDGGVVSNTPLQWLVDRKAFVDTLVFQIDLWSSKGEFPRNMVETLTRQKDIQYSSRTRSNTERFQQEHQMRHKIAKMLKLLPPDLKSSSEAKSLAGHADDSVYNIVHLICHNRDFEGYAKDVEFSRYNMELHWRTGYGDTLHALRHPDVLKRPRNADGIAIFDFSSDDRKNQNEEQTKAA
jgi:NTE family protein